MAATFGIDDLPVRRLAAFVENFLTRDRFGTSARRGENGFVLGRIVSSALLRRNIHLKKSNDFNGDKSEVVKIKKTAPVQ